MRRLGSRFGRGGPLPCPCVHCKRDIWVCDAEPCLERVARGEAPKPIAKAEPLVCTACGRPGCWTDKAGCPGVKGETA